MEAEPGPRFLRCITSGKNQLQVFLCNTYAVIGNIKAEKILIDIGFDPNVPLILSQNSSLALTLNMSHNIYNKCKTYLTEY